MVVSNDSNFFITYLSVATSFDYVFSENGLVYFQDGVQKGSESIKNYLGVDKLKKLVSFCLKYIGELDIPVKT